MTIRLLLVGLGKIARDQHLPAIAATDGIEIAAVASRNATLDDVPCFPDVHAALASGVAIDAVSLCTPPQGRFQQAKAALVAGKHLMLEKPPGMTVTEARAIGDLATARGLTAFATWHSREAAAVEPVRVLLGSRRIRSVKIVWKEDVRKWHPGQQWIWEPGGLGVFDPGINALSIVTRILPEPIRVTRAVLDFPENRKAPIAAKLSFTASSGFPVEAEFDWRQTGPQTWDVEVDTDEGRLKLSHGGSRLELEGHDGTSAPDLEYQRLYARFVDLAGRGDSDLDLSPIEHVADAFLIGEHRSVDPFID